MDIPIQDEHPVEPELADRELGRDRDVVEQTEPHRLFAPGMVPGGPKPTERCLGVAAQERADHRAGAAGGVQRRRVGRLSDERVLVELTAAAQRHPTDESDERRRVHELELSDGRCRRLHPQTPCPAGPLER